MNVPTIPAERLYWGVLPSGQRRLRSPAQDFAFERVLPVSVESLHVSRTLLPDGRMVLCGIEPERLRTWLEGQPGAPAWWELVPDRLPPAIGMDGGSTRDLDLLHGPFEPPARRRLRQRGTGILLGGILVAATLVLAGAEWRRSRILDHAAALDARAAAALAAVVPVKPGEAHPELRLTMETRRLEQAAKVLLRSGGDAAAVAAALARVWPQELKVQVENLSLTSERVVIRGRVPTLADAEKLHQACAAMAQGPVRLRAEPLQAQQGERRAEFLITLAAVDAARGRAP